MTTFEYDPAHGAQARLWEHQGDPLNDIDRQQLAMYMANLNNPDLWWNRWVVALELECKLLGFSPWQYRDGGEIKAMWDSERRPTVATVTRHLYEAHKAVQAYEEGVAKGYIKDPNAPTCIGPNCDGRETKAVWYVEYKAPMTSPKSEVAVCGPCLLDVLDPALSQVVRPVKPLVYSEGL